MKTTIDSARVIGVIGLAKNTGKTTTLNALTAKQRARDIAITSIGLDGEAIDQVTHLPKPRIHVRKGSVIATAEGTLAHAECNLDVLETTSLTTALGPVVIARALCPGNAVIAGPTSNKDLSALIERLKTHAPSVYVDGAFNRLTFANVAAFDGVVLATGAAVNKDMEKTLTKTDHVLNLFALPVDHESVKDAFAIDTHRKRVTHTKRSMQTIVESEDPVQTVHWPGAFTEQSAARLVRHRLGNFTLVLDDATKALFNERTMRHLKTLRITLRVRRAIAVLLVTLNPQSPTGHHYNKDAFLKAAKARFNVPVINVMDKEDTAHETIP